MFNKLILLAIALGIWVNAVATWTRVVEADAQFASSQAYLSELTDLTDLRDIERDVHALSPDLSNISEDVHGIATNGMRCNNTKIC
jgi:hypothetical protein